MPIKKREIAPELRNQSWTHRVNHRQFLGHLAVASERILNASPQLHWTVGMRFDAVREKLQRDSHEIQEIKRKRKT